MRLHTDKITSGDVVTVMRTLTAEGKIKGVYAETRFSGSRKRARGMDLWLSAEARPGRRRKTNAGCAYPGREGAGVDVAATWDEWGIVLAALYEIDPDLTGDYYADAEHYHWSTGERFEDGGPETPHDNHSWDYTGATATGAYVVHECTKCGAVKRRVLGSDFERVFGRQYGERIGASA